MSFISFQQRRMSADLARNGERGGQGEKRTGDLNAGRGCGRCCGRCCGRRAAVRGHTIYRNMGSPVRGGVRRGTGMSAVQRGADLAAGGRYRPGIRGTGRGEMQESFRENAFPEKKPDPGGPGMAICQKQRRRGSDHHPVPRHRSWGAGEFLALSGEDRREAGRNGRKTAKKLEFSLKITF